MSLSLSNSRTRASSRVAPRLVGIAAWYLALVVVTEAFAPRHSGLSAVMMGGSVSWGVAIAGRSGLGAVELLGWVFAGTLAVSLPLAWTRALTSRRRRYSQAMSQALLLVPLLAASVVLVVPHGVVAAAVLVLLVVPARPGRPTQRMSDATALAVATAIGISAARGMLLVGLVAGSVYCAATLLCTWLDVARRPERGLRRRWGIRKPTGAASTNDAQAGDEARHARVHRRSLLKSRDDAEFLSAARAWRERLEITTEPGARAGDSKFNATLRINSVGGERARETLERVLRERTRRWELRASEPGHEGTTVLWYGVRVPRTSRGRLLDALQAAPHAVGVELR